MDEPVKMGMPSSLTDPNVIFPRTYRFLFVPKKKPDLQYLIKKVTVDFYQRTIDAKIMETAPGLDSQDWVVEMMESSLSNPYMDDYTLTALDGCGNRLYMLEFKDVKGIWHNVEFDYEKSDVVTHHIALEYESMKRTNYSKSKS